SDQQGLFSPSVTAGLVGSRFIVARGPLIASVLHRRLWLNKIEVRPPLGDKQFEVFVTLMLHEGCVDKLALFEAIWPYGDDAKALDVTVYRLRRSMRRPLPNFRI